MGQDMSERDYSKRHFWDIKVDKGLLYLLDPDKEMHVYVKWDGDVHIWYYGDKKPEFEQDTGLVDHSDWMPETDTGWHSDLYRLFDVDEEIARLQSLKTLAAKWFDEHKNQRWPPDMQNLDSNTIRLDELAWNDPRRDKEGDDL